MGLFSIVSKAQLKPYILQQKVSLYFRKAQVGLKADIQKYLSSSNL